MRFLREGWIDEQIIVFPPHQPRGILPSEMALFISVLRFLKIEAIIESGRARGYSTLCMATYLPDMRVVSYDIRTGESDDFACSVLNDLPNVSIRYGDINDTLADTITECANMRMALLVDGPKGVPALELVDRHREAFIIAGVHDLRRIVKNAASESRAVAERMFPNAIFTDDQRLVKAFAYMDRGAWGPTWMPYYTAKLQRTDASLIRAGRHVEFLGSWGPTLAIIPLTEEAVGAIQ